MNLESVGEVVQRIVSRREAHKGGHVAFDADGTLWSGDVGDDLWNAMIECEAFLPEAHAGLQRVASDAGVDVRGSASELAWSIARAHLDGAVSEERMLEVVAWGLAGRHIAQVRTFVRDVLHEVDLMRRLHVESIEVLRALQRLGVEVFVVSASPRAIVEDAVFQLGIDPSHVIAATAALEDGVMTTRLQQPIPYGPGKVSGLRQYAPDQKLLAAFGDNHFDAAMLRLADVPVAVRPKPKLRASSTSIPGVVELFGGAELRRGSTLG